MLCVAFMHKQRMCWNMMDGLTMGWRRTEDGKVKRSPFDVITMTPSRDSIVGPMFTNLNYVS